VRISTGLVSGTKPYALGSSSIFTLRIINFDFTMRSHAIKPTLLRCQIATLTLTPRLTPIMGGMQYVCMQ
jgi:hypothetical protein